MGKVEGGSWKTSLVQPRFGPVCSGKRQADFLFRTSDLTRNAGDLYKICGLEVHDPKSLIYLKNDNKHIQSDHTYGFEP